MQEFICYESKFDQDIRLGKILKVTDDDLEEEKKEEKVQAGLSQQLDRMTLDKTRLFLLGPNGTKELKKNIGQRQKNYRNN